jgi:hypothetical protein
MRLFLIVGLAVLLMASARAENQTYIGPGYAFGIAPPLHWTKSQPNFAPVLLVPSGNNPSDSPTEIYVRPVLKAPLKVRTAAEMNALDLREMKARIPTVQSRRLQDIRTSTGATAEVYEFIGGRFHEFVAYFDEGNTIVLIVLSSEVSPSEKASKAAWESLVTSYRWLPELVGS